MTWRHNGSRRRRSHGKKFRPAIEPPYRWRDWAANPQGITGDELLAFINQDEAVRPDGKRGARASSPTCGGSPAPTATTAATSSPPCSAASTTG